MHISLETRKEILLKLLASNTITKTEAHIYFVFRIEPDESMQHGFENRLGGKPKVYEVLDKIDSLITPRKKEGTVDEIQEDRTAGV